MQLSSRPSSVFLITCAIAVVGACDGDVEGAAGESPATVDEVDVVRQSFRGYGCGQGQCGSNAKWVLGNGISEFDLTGRYANAQGFVYDRFVDSRGRAALLGVDKDKLVATRFSRSASGVLRFERLEGDDLIGGRLLFHTQGSKTQHALIIADRDDSLSYQVPPRRSVSSYSFVVVEDMANPWKSIGALCNHTGLENKAVTWSGDRYTGPRFKVSSEDQPGGIVQPGGVPGNWFNIGCVGYAGSKLLLFRHSAASATDAYRPSLAQRQALLKSLVADVCGDGRSFTETGTPLYFQAKASGWDLSCSRRPEAIWDENGMVCLDYFRSAPTASRWQAVSAAIRCNVPSCTATQLDKWKRHGKVLTSVPSNPGCEMIPSPGTVITPKAIPQRLP